MTLAANAAIDYENSSMPTETMSVTDILCMRFVLLGRSVLLSCLVLGSLVLPILLFLFPLHPPLLGRDHIHPLILTLVSFMMYPPLNQMLMLRIIRIQHL